MLNNHLHVYVNLDVLCEFYFCHFSRFYQLKINVRRNQTTIMNNTGIIYLFHNLEIQMELISSEKVYSMNRNLIKIYKNTDQQFV